MNAFLWLVGEKIVLKLLDKALENEKKPIDTKSSDTLLDRVRQRISQKKRTE